MEEYVVNLLDNTDAVLVNKFYSSHAGPITKAERITNEVDFFIIGNEITL